MFKIVSGGEVATVLATKKAWQGGGPLDVFMLAQGVAVFLVLCHGFRSSMEAS